MTLAQLAQNLNPLDETCYRFAGFSSPNATAVPDAFFDELAPHLSEAELRITLYIIRRTFGFKKQADPIAFSQFLHGITTHDGRVLDIGCGVKSRGHLSKALKSLVGKGVVVAVKSHKANGSQAVTAYGLRFSAGVVPEANHPGSRSEPPLVPEVNPQETGETTNRETGDSKIRKAPPENKHVDNCGDSFRPTPYLDQVITDFSREFGDSLHAVSNRKQARNILAALDISEEQFVDEHVYPARVTTRLATGIDKRMPYFFAVLHDMTGEKTTQIADE